MSLPEQEARALERAREFLLALSSGRHPARPIRDLRAEARDIAKHYPLDVGHRWMSEVSQNRCHFAMSPNRADETKPSTNSDLGSHK